MFTIKETTADFLIALRYKVLRPGRPERMAHFAGDNENSTVHFGAFDKNQSVIGCATVIETQSGLQLRGMATAPEWQGKGVGRAVLEAAQSHAQKRGLPLWCNARVSAQAFYEKCGWHTEGEIFEVPDVGPHAIMRFS